MATYRYEARNGAGETTLGTIEAESREDALLSLRGNGLTPSSIEEAGTGGGGLSFGTRKVKEKSLSIMCQQLAIIIRSGIPIVRAMELVGNQSDDKRLKEVLQASAQDVSAGLALADAFAKNAGDSLPATFIETVRAGEASGNLDTVFARLSQYYRKSSRTKAKVKSAMIYPAFVLVVAVIVVIVIMMFAIPTFSATFAGMGQEMPLVTQVLIAVSGFMTAYWWLLLGIVAAAVVGVRLGLRNDAFHMQWSRLGLRIPVLGRINLMTAGSQYASTMGIMMTAGLSTYTSVGVTARSLSNFFIGRRLVSVQPEIEAGRPLGASLADIDVFPELVNEMTRVGEETGSLESTLNVLAEYYDNEVETATQRAMSLLEPTMIVFLAAIVLVILLAVYLPMFDIYGSYGQ